MDFFHVVKDTEADNVATPLKCERVKGSNISRMMDVMRNLISSGLTVPLLAFHNSFQNNLMFPACQSILCSSSHAVANIHRAQISQTNQSVDYVAVCLQPPNMVNVTSAHLWKYREPVPVRHILLLPV
jgi:hypothetical protein